MVMTAMPILETERICSSRGNPPIWISMGRVMSFSTSGGDMPPALAMTCTCTLVTSGKASMGICLTASTPKPAMTSVPSSTSIRWRTEKLRMGLIMTS